MNKSKEIKKIKVIFSLFIILSNAIVYLLVSNPTIEEKSIDKSRFREDHFLFKISADLKVPFNTSIPVTLVSKNQKHIIKNVFLISKIENSGIKITENLSSLSEYFVQVHKSQFSKLNSSSFFYVYPNSINYQVTKTKRTSHYEINY